MSRGSANNSWRPTGRTGWPARARGGRPMTITKRPIQLLRQNRCRCRCGLGRSTGAEPRAAKVETTPGALQTARADPSASAGGGAVADFAGVAVAEEAGHSSPCKVMRADLHTPVGRPDRPATGQRPPISGRLRSNAAPPTTTPAPAPSSGPVIASLAVGCFALDGLIAFRRACPLTRLPSSASSFRNRRRMAGSASGPWRRDSRFSPRLP